MSINCGLVVGELSGDLLAANLLQAWLEKTKLNVSGVLGPNCLAQTGTSLYPMDNLSVMGFWEPLKRLPLLLQMRKRLYQHFLSTRPDVFIGVDAPDFNLGLESRLKEAKIKTVHCVSPSVWAWRPGRIKKIKAACDLMLCLLPFEQKFYQEHQMRAEFVGHPFADEISLNCPKEIAQAALGLPVKQDYIGIFPGSRDSELHYTLVDYFKAASLLLKSLPNSQFLLGLAKTSHVTLAKDLLATTKLELPIQIFCQQTRLVMQAVDGAMVTSGTASLELLLLNKPMVVAYKMQGLGFQIAKRLVRVPYISLPNLLCKNPWVPELIQSDCNAENLANKLLEQLEGNNRQTAMLKEFREVHELLRCKASTKMLSAIETLL